ncbi:UDP-N-acetylglucosamine--N-acetylmuramyl-(pentapeptide) pyrophosphoryl-undecaprenol N-acetylglucosamine transferase OS=Streptomyces tendae OX=1932 GN=murG PE=3 SV=1 [Streptomyces tendae]
MPGMPPYIPVSYLDRMDLAYAAADMMLCRAGAMTVAELSAVGLPAAYVPLPIGNGEQRLNAQPVVKAGGGLLVDDAELTPEWLQQNVLPVLADPHRLYEMSRAAAEFGRQVLRGGDRVVERSAGSGRSRPARSSSGCR